jgi:hypothetical protein
MKRIFSISICFGLLLILSSCDKTLYVNFKIQNNCNDTILVEGIGGRYQAQEMPFSLKVSPNVETLFYQGTAIIPFGCTKEDVPYYIKKLNIKRENKILNYNPLYNLDKWYFVQIKDDTYEMTLYINPEDFE